jgi:hypothetical protein
MRLLQHRWTDKMVQLVFSVRPDRNLLRRAPRVASSMQADKLGGNSRSVAN